MIVRLFIYIENDIFIDNENEIILIEQLRSIFLLKNKNIIYIYIYICPNHSKILGPSPPTNKHAIRIFFF